jgi:hypothetical protein
MINRITKPAWNEEYRAFEFKRPDGKGQLNDTETLTTAAVICTEEATGADTSATMIAEAAVYNSTAVKYKLKGGTKGLIYRLEFQVVTSNNQKLSDTLVVEVI